MSNNNRTCDYCREPFTPKRKGQRFCTDPQKACRQKWHKQNAQLPGVASRIVQRANGQWSVTIQHPTLPPIKRGDQVRIETTAKKRPDASCEGNA